MYKTPEGRIADMTRGQLIELFLEDTTMEDLLIMVKEYMLYDEATDTEHLRENLMEWHK